MYARGNNRRLLFIDDVDRDGYLGLLGKVVARQRWRCLSYCLMDNHVHMLIETPEPNLGDGMRLLHGDFARGHNRRHRTSGHVFQGRFGSKPLRSEGHLWTAAAYIAANPVDAGMCAEPERVALGQSLLGDGCRGRGPRSRSAVAGPRAALWASLGVG